MVENISITLLLSVIGGILAILTFIFGLNAKAQKEGVLEQKINQALKGIEEIKNDLKSTASIQSSMALLVNSHEEQIKTLFSNVASLSTRLDSSKTTNETLIAILKHIQDLNVNT